MTSNRYTQIVERIFFSHFKKGMTSFQFSREEIETSAIELKIKLPKNIGDIIYSFRFRNEMPQSIRDTAVGEKSWVIKLAGKSTYKFILERQWIIKPNQGLIQIKVPDATPGIVARYALTDEQALLALVRYNRLVDIFTGVASYSLQSHLRTAVDDIGQVEVDELYVGVDRSGAHYVFPLQAKGGRDNMSAVQIEQDIALCAERFSKLICRPIGAQFLINGGIALMEFAPTPEGLRLITERHYVLVPREELTDSDLSVYRATSDTSR